MQTITCWRPLVKLPSQIIYRGQGKPCTADDILNHISNTAGRQFIKKSRGLECENKNFIKTANQQCNKSGVTTLIIEHDLYNALYMMLANHEDPSDCWRFKLFCDYTQMRQYLRLSIWILHFCVSWGSITKNNCGSFYRKERYWMLIVKQYLTYKKRSSWYTSMST